MELNWSSLTIVVEFHNQTQEKKIPKYVQRQIEKDAPFRFVQQFLIEVPIYWRIGWLCEIVKWGTNDKPILIIIVIKIICQYDHND